MAKKCPICGKSYRDYIIHIWTHKAKTVKWLAARRAAAPKKSRKESRLSSRKESGKYCPSCGKRL